MEIEQRLEVSVLDQRTGATLTATSMPPATKSDAAYAMLRHMILDGSLLPGAAIDQEALAERLGVSTTPVREALRRLAAEHLVILSAHREVRIAPLSRRDLVDLYEVRLELDPLAAYLATAAASDDELEVPWLLAQQTAPVDAIDRMRFNRGFHEAIYTRCGNDSLVQILDVLWDRTDRYRIAMIQSTETQSMVDTEHLAIAESFRRRDGDGLRQLIRDHLAGTLEHLLSPAHIPRVFG